MSINSENVYTKNPCDENVNMSDTPNKEDAATDTKSLSFPEWVSKNYKYEKGRYRHLGDFYKNDKLKSINELYELFKSKTLIHLKTST